MKMKKRFCVISFLLICAVAVPPNADAQLGMVKNVVVMIADGCGINQILVTNYWQGTSQVYQSFPIQLYMSTYSQNGIEEAAPEPAYDPEQAWTDFWYMLLRATDSSSSATAMSTGVKTYDGRVNIGPDGATLFTVTERAQQLGKSTGVVTSVEWSHATPAGFAAHNISRDNYVQIAQEMLASDLNVIMGCGHPYFNNNHVPVTPTVPSDWKYVGGQTQWNALANGQTVWTLIESREEFLEIIDNPSPPEKLCGTAECRTTLQEARDLVASEGANTNALPYSAPRNDVPTLAEMTRAALNVLDENPEGFFLMVEGGAVDWANHSNFLNRCIEEETEFNQAIEAVVAWIETNSNWNESLLIVTGDHESGYLWGPDSGAPSTFVEVVNNGAGHLPGAWYYTTGHSNSLLPIFAKGSSSGWLDVFADEVDPRRGRYIDNTEIARLIFGFYDEILAVELSSFKVLPYQDRIAIHWTTASEIDNNRFELERNGQIRAVVQAENKATGSSYLWEDHSVQNGARYTYTLYSVDIRGTRERLASEMVTVAALQATAITGYALHPNWPNPFNATTIIRYDVVESGWVRVLVFDLLGRQVTTLVDTVCQPGSYTVSWNAANLPSGIYLCLMEAGNFAQTRKMLLVK
jgi:alkaline phosphatase